MALPVLLGATVPSVDDCSRSAPPAPAQGRLECLGTGCWLPSESPAGLRRNARLECVGIRRLTPCAGRAGPTGASHAWPAARDLVLLADPRLVARPEVVAPWPRLWHVRNGCP